MNRFALRPACLGVGFSLLACFAASAGAAEPLLRRVVMSTGGVALYEYTATVNDAGQPLALVVRRDQVDDVLRSLMVSDSTGPVTMVRLAGQAPLAEVFRDLPVTEEDLASPAALFEALKGASVTVAGARGFSGRVLSVTEEQAGDPPTRRHRLGLMTAQGVRQVVLEEAESLSFDDPDLAAAVRSALAALAAQVHKDLRTLEILPAPGGPRTVRLAYVAEAPLWKASYRLGLPATGAEGRLAGWAVLENLTGQDWLDARLSVVSGAPVTFRQELYAPYWVERPLVPVEIEGRVLPPPDHAPPVMQAKAAFSPPAPLAAPMALARGLAADQEAGGGGPEPVEAVADVVTAQVVYTFPAPISLGRGQTLMAPLVDRGVPVRRVSHLRPETGDLRPLAAVEITNSTDTALPPGAVSLTEETRGGLAYLGDARLTSLPPGESRLLAFAVDHDVVVRQDREEDRRVAGLGAARGVLSLRQVARAETTYGLRNAAAEPRTVIIDHPARPGWTLVPPDGVAVQAMAGVHRLSLEVAAGEEKTLVVRQERTEMETLEAGGLEAEALARLSADGSLSDKERHAVEGLAQLAARVAQYESRVQQIRQDLAEVAAAQEGVRKNLQAVPPGGDLHTRFLDRLGQLDERQNALESQVAEARHEEEQARADLATLVASLSLP
ncbi:hypothetical protein [Pararhodospirillum photometricum]|uniref:DUF4139 domain-containing protein n=1 Tax=Pararhodospirillum photometricum DSM 122 TaxID=1150469 RepID=H6SR57_PARPM|nr:hypothetical protein [Pararhodospirillum photometricum]CCG09779.1 Putative uncharacterized protein [Pararhodospirillum photometricum DSM 122]